MNTHDIGVFEVLSPNEIDPNDIRREARTIPDSREWETWNPVEDKENTHW